MRIRTRVAVVGAGPAGLVVANTLQQAGIDTVVVESRSRAHVESRARAGLIEHRTVELLDALGLAGRLREEGTVHGSCEFRHRGERFSVPYRELAGGRAHHVYPQQALVRDMITAHLDLGGRAHFSHPAVAVTGLDGDRALVRCEPLPEAGEEPLEIECDFVAGCDGFHGVSRTTAAHRLTAHERRHEFGWLAVLAETPPATEEIVYALHRDGFAGHMLRTPEVSRFYLQCPVGDRVENWPDERIWTALRRRLDMDETVLREGPLIEKSMVDMRSVVTEPMQSGRLLLAGDAAHVISPAGGKGMNLAIADAAELSRRLIAHYQGDAGAPAGYSAARLPDIWRAQEFSHWMLHLLHSPDPAERDAAFLYRLQLSRLAQLRDHPAYARNFADGYAGPWPGGCSVS
ncbi:4-hydroxybenzoate 3-monooxygenase [Kitasatospora sp. NPDC006697]|uniref:4-hydroxybenzoate 3-monooxygenase n=1 Tax=Kitasatospora sp. NPDC006697 TaxID=3364020 RepID=UPI0036C97B2F